MTYADDISGFARRHLGPGENDLNLMLEAVGADTLDQLIDETVPEQIRLKAPLDLPPPETEDRYLRRLRSLADENRILTSCIGQGYYDCITPSVILRNVMENPGWYTPYTPYQAEIAQGRLEALLNFQTMVQDLTGMEASNASLLDEATAAAEAMTMMYRIQRRRAREGGRSVFLAADTCFPQTLEVLRTRAEPLGIDLDVVPAGEMTFRPDVFGLLLQSPDARGALHDVAPLIEAVHDQDILVAVATDLLALTVVRPPGEMGADIALGNAQRFGVPMGFGGPHAAFFATRQRFVREMPGRIIGVSVDVAGRRAYRMALQTREQHIRREKAKSNICTAQALLANMAGFYAVYHGPDGLRAIAERLHGVARKLDQAVAGLGYRRLHEHYFDTLYVDTGDPGGGVSDRLRTLAEEAGYNLHYAGPSVVGVSVGESLDEADVQRVAELFRQARGDSSVLSDPSDRSDTALPETLRRTSPYLEHPVFHRYRTETDMMRYLKSLERKDIGLDTSMIPLGSCTMKLNAATEMMPVTWPAFSRLHPFAPAGQAAGYARIIEELEQMLCEITGLHAVSFQPNSGAQGEYAGLLAIRAYHRARGEDQRNVALIPASAHGTNPASAVMAGMEVVVVACDASGNIDLDDLKAHSTAHRDRLAALMVTYPSTHGVFEEAIGDICALVHEAGGQVYLDGANLNAQVGLTSPGVIGADVCHINLHKTFGIPHGGGGPGMGPIAVAEHLAPFLPGHGVTGRGGPQSIPAVSAAPFGSAAILLISYGYLRLLGARGATEASRCAILNANYVKARLEGHYEVRYTGRHGRVAHEMILDLHAFKEASGADEEDVAKRLMDYGFHAPTVSWPVPGTMMIEPTETESRAELDRFCDALISIHGEMREVAEGRAHASDNVLMNAPHAVGDVTGDAWDHPYPRSRAAYPLPFVRERKFWPPVSRIDNPYGDRHLFCACPPLDD